MTKFKIIVIGVIALSAGTASLVIQHAAQVKGHENGAVSGVVSNGEAETNRASDPAATNGFGTHTESVVEPK